MTYESTGEVRVPRKGEQFLMFPLTYSYTERDIHPPLKHDGEYWDNTPRVIMRPVEPREVVGYQVVLTIPSNVPIDNQEMVAKSWIGYIKRANETVNPEIKELYA
jgi:hypothetical protein